MVKLEKGKKYYVKGFNFKGESLLYDELFGIDYWVPTKNDGQFCRIAGLSDRTAGQWERQIFKNGCWLAAVAVLGGKTQRDIQQSLGWSDDAFYAIVMEKEMAEFGQMCGTELTTINYMSADAIYNAVDGRKPVMLGVPGHVVVIYAMSADKQQVSVWDPDGAKLKPWTMDDVKKFGKLAFIAKNHRL